MAPLTALCVALCATLASAHSVITYPGWRGNNLITNQTFPFGMQWMYPCGGLGVSSNRTYWPLNGGAIAVQPGWFQGHATALFYINMGLGENPANYSLPMVPLFQITGPSNNPYPGTFCLPQVPLPAGVTVKSGDLASIQVIEVAKHGAGQYNCVDIIFTDDTSKIPELTTDKCFNSTDIKVNNVKIDLGSGGGAATTATLPPTRTGLFNTPSPTAAANQAAARHVSRFSALMSFMFMI